MIKNDYDELRCFVRFYKHLSHIVANPFIPGEDCSRPCPTGKFGPNCVHDCYCHNGYIRLIPTRVDYLHDVLFEAQFEISQINF